MSEYCQFCGKPIQGKPNLFHHNLWQPGQMLRVCHNCLSQNPRCQICGIPMANNMQPVCPTCNQNLLVCLGCSKAILTPRYYEIAGKSPYCQSCSQTPPSCDICGQPFLEKRWQLSDGRQYCEQCYGTTINDLKTANDLLRDVHSRMENLFQFQLNVPTSLSLVDRNQLAEVMRSQNTVLLEPPEQTLGIYARKGIKRGIYVQTGLPRILFIQICAHELMHAWQGENCPLLHNPVVREGLAEWAAYRVLEILGEKRQGSIMLQRTDMYGQGLRWALQQESKAGWESLLETCRQSD